MAAPNYTLATVTKNPDGTYTLGNRPADAYAGATVGAAGEKVPVPIANFGGPAEEFGRHGSGASSVIFGDFLHQNDASGQYSLCLGGYNNLASGENSAVYGGNNTEVFGKFCSALDSVGCTIPSGCEGVRLYNCTGFTVPVGTNNATYINNQLVGGGVARDPLAVGDVKTITDAVTDASNTWVNGDLADFGSTALRNAGAPPAVANQNASILVGTADVATMDEFDMTDTNGDAWRYRYSRRNDGTSGWTRIAKLK